MTLRHTFASDASGKVHAAAVAELTPVAVSCPEAGAVAFHEPSATSISGAGLHTTKAQGLRLVTGWLPSNFFTRVHYGLPLGTGESRGAFPLPGFQGGCAFAVLIIGPGRTHLARCQVTVNGAACDTVAGTNDLALYAPEELL